MVGGCEERLENICPNSFNSMQPILQPKSNKAPSAIPDVDESPSAIPSTDTKIIHANLKQGIFSQFHSDFCYLFAESILHTKIPTFLIVSIYSLGDTYLLCAHARCFRQIHCKNGEKLALLIKKSHIGVAELFLDDIDFIYVLEGSTLDATVSYLFTHGIKSAFGTNQALFIHPHHVNDTRVDDFTNLEGVSQAQMYANLLRLPIHSPIALPRPKPEYFRKAEGLCHQMGFIRGRTAVLFPDSNSWPPVSEDFWKRLPAVISQAGWTVFTNAAGDHRGPRRTPLPGTKLAEFPLELAIPVLAYAGWAIGALCGFMNVVISSRVPCRKTVVVRGPARGRELRFNEYIAVRSPFPYARQRKFDGLDYDIDEIQVRDDSDYEMVARRIVLGFSADPSVVPTANPVNRVMVQLSPGEVADRISVLEVKIEKLPPDKHPYIIRELEALRETLQDFVRDSDSTIEQRIEALRRLNREGWKMNEVIYNAFDDRRFGSADWDLNTNDPVEVRNTASVVKAFRASQAVNRERIVIKNEINQLLGCDWSERKSFDDGTNETDHS